ncbi:hypothetical protein JZ751_002056 [Albula glossodonta]|uniref:Interleukin-12 subunit alpha n=1 Tax=Albula glossodonta TaxID=121402 RepID=A0A8T2PAS2_9TELE|nr:hypothetical protein JZ751_002056 [Albula glossodonta]
MTVPAALGNLQPSKAGATVEEKWPLRREFQNISVRAGLATWLFLGALCFHLSGVSVASPLSTSEKTDKQACVNFSRSLLENVRHALTLNALFDGFNCTELPIMLDTTVSACEPDVGENECLKSIKQDLEYYRDKLLAHQREELRSTVVRAIQDLLENPRNSETDFQRRVRLCGELKGFQVRTVTINRIMGYMASEDNKN